MFGTSTRYGNKIPPPPDLGHVTLSIAEQQQVRSKLKAAAYGMKGVDWHKLFRHYDRDNTGELGFHEFKRAIRGDAKISVSTLPNSQVLHLFNSIDTDNGGTIDVEEFITWVEEEDGESESAAKMRRRRSRKVSSGYGRVSPSEMSSPSQRRFDVDRGRFLNDNHENSCAEGAFFQQESPSVLRAMEEAEFALGIERSQSSPSDIVLSLPSPQKRSTKKKVSTKKKSAFINFEKSLLTTTVAKKSSPLVSRLQREKESQDAIIKSQAEQLQVLKMLVNQQFDALTPTNSHHARTPLFVTGMNDNNREGEGEGERSIDDGDRWYACKCHCGKNVGRFRCSIAKTLTCWQCNCSDCAMRGNVHFIVPKDNFVVEHGNDEQSTTLYQWGTKTAQRRFCKTCGILPWYVPRSNPDGIGVTLKCVDWGLNARPSIKTNQYDGIHWEKSYKDTHIEDESKTILQRIGTEQLLFSGAGAGAGDRSRSPSRGSTFSVQSADQVEL
jgi:hypothetical protein